MSRRSNLFKGSAAYLQGTASKYKKSSIPKSENGGNFLLKNVITYVRPNRLHFTNFPVLSICTHLPLASSTLARPSLKCSAFSHLHEITKRPVLSI